MATTVSRPKICRFKCASALSSPVSLWRQREVGSYGQSPSRNARKSSCSPRSSSLMKTLALMCIAFTRTIPSRTPLRFTASATRSVMLTNSILDFVSNQRYSVSDFMGSDDTHQEGRMRFAAAVLVSIAGTAWALQPPQEPKAPVVKASRFELVDGEGRTRAVLGMSKAGSPEFDLRDP